MTSVTTLVLLAAVPLLSAQETPAPPKPAAPPVLENNGKPIQVPFQCTAEDMTTAGLSCTEEEPCPIYLELTAAEGSGPHIFAVGNIHSAAVTLFTVLLVSDDAGHIWREAADRIRAAGLDRIQLLDAETVWASGDTLSPILQDPFLLLTTDGGKSWRQRAIFGDTRENRYGSILEFYFSAKDNGALVVDRGAGSEGDRYELFDSPNGGESWNIKETSAKAIKLKRPPAAAGEWRVRADAPTQSFHVEHRQGARWTNVASFAVKLTPCKPEAER